LLKVQQKETLNTTGLPNIPGVPPAGRILAVDPGTKRVGIAVSDEKRIIATPLRAIARTSWKKLLSEIQSVIAEYDAAAIVVGLPLNTDGTESFMSSEARDMARKLTLSLSIPVLLQDERVTSYEARKRLWDRGVELEKTKQLVDSEAASIILTDFLDRLQAK
jgi:putative Holliday junction resolvase